MDDLRKLTLDQLLIRADGQHQRAGVPHETADALVQVRRIRREIELRRSDGVPVA
jgi:hypothetical protein